MNQKFRNILETKIDLVDKIIKLVKSETDSPMEAIFILAWAISTIGYMQGEKDYAPNLSN